MASISTNTQRTRFRVVAHALPPASPHALSKAFLAALLTVIPFGILIGGAASASAAPYQLIENETAILISKHSGEFKVDVANEEGPIPVQLLTTQFRYGVFSWMEATAGVTLVNFPDQELQRVADSRVRLKFEIFSAFDHQFYTYVRYREAIGDPIIIPFTQVPGVRRAVSPYADGGRDTTIGILGRNRRHMRDYIYNFGIALTRATGRNFENFADPQYIVDGVFSVHWLFFRQELMVAIENKYAYWLGRGDYLDVVPQVRWEFTPDWILEAGVSLPAIGAGVTRQIIGLTYEFE